jgi:hypothetical protein
VRVVQDTWARDIGPDGQLIFYSDEEDRNVPTVGLEPSAKEQIYSSGAWRNFPALMHLHDHREELGCFNWVYFCDDDTYVFPRALENTLGRFMPREQHYLGVYHTARVDLEWKDPEARIAYAHGGAGYIVSWALLKAVRPYLAACHERYTQWAGDLRAGRCLIMAGGRVADIKGLYPEPPAHYHWGDAATMAKERGLSRYASAELQQPISFHHLSAEVMYDLDRSSTVVERDGAGQLWVHELSPWLFHEYIFDCPPDEREEPSPACRLLFGFSLDRHLGANRGGYLPPPGKRQWKPMFDSLGTIDHAGNSTYVFTHGTSLVLANKVYGVKYPFTRDTCEASQGGGGGGGGSSATERRAAGGFDGRVRHKRAVVRLTCGEDCPEPSILRHPAAKAGPNPLGRVCSVRLDPTGCDLMVHVASPSCPTRRLRIFHAASLFAQQLGAAPETELAVAPGAAEALAFQNGEPAPCWRGHANAATDCGFSAPTLTLQLRVASSLPVRVGKPSASCHPPGALHSLVLAGSLVATGQSWVDQTTSAVFTVSTRCNLSRSGQSVAVRVRVPVDGDNYEPLVVHFSQRC